MQQESRDRSEEKEQQRQKQINDAIEFLRKNGNEEDVARVIENMKNAKQQMSEKSERVKRKINHGRILRDVIRSTRTYKLLIFFLVLFFALAGILCLCEPDIHNYADSLWICFATATTIGYGDIVATTILGRICLVILSLYAIILTAILTSVIVSYHNQVLAAQRKDSIQAFFDKLERLPELSPEELAELSEMVKNYK